MTPPAPSGAVMSPDGSDARLRKLIDLGIALTSERDVDRLLDRILFEARQFTGADAGTLYVVEKNKLRFAVVQNDAIPAATISAHTPEGCGAIEITRTSIAGHVAGTGHVLNLCDVQNLPPGVEYSFNDSFDRQTNYRTVSMLTVPMKNPAHKVIGVIQLINCCHDTGFDPKGEDLVLALASQAAVALENAQLVTQLAESYRETVFRLARAAEFRDTDTGEHIHRVSQYAAEIARVFRFSEEEIQRLILAASLHDVGKIAVADGVLKKPGRFTDEDRREMEKHTTYGADILANGTTPVLELSHQIALTHHEKWDGTGYPRGLRQEEIPLCGRICALADVFDALTTKRVYKDAMPVEKACAIIREGRGTHFDPAVVDAFFLVFDQIERVKATYSH